MAYETNNIFARILRGEAPCVEVVEDEQALAFMNLMPQAEGHTLIVPKEPAETILELSQTSGAACISMAHRLAPAIVAAVGAEGVMLSKVNGRAAGQSVPHVQFHLIPHWSGRELKAHAAEPADMKAIAAAVRKRFGRVDVLVNNAGLLETIPSPPSTKLNKSSTASSAPASRVPS